VQCYVVVAVKSPQLFVLVHALQLLVFRVTSGGAPAKSSTLTLKAATAAVQSATQLSVEEVLALLAISDQQGLEVRRQYIMFQQQHCNF
jgi:hypothetical protein